MLKCFLTYHCKQNQPHKRGKFPHQLIIAADKSGVAAEAKWFCTAKIYQQTQQYKVKSINLSKLYHKIKCKHLKSAILIASEISTTAWIFHHQMRNFTCLQRWRLPRKFLQTAYTMTRKSLARRACKKFAYFLSSG